MFKLIGGLLMIGGAIAGALGLISGIGYFLYNWGALDVAVGASAWTGFVLTLKMWAGGLISVIAGLLLSGIGE